MSNMPEQKRHSSKQAVGTPRELLAAVEKRFGHIGLDLAANASNNIKDCYYAPSQLELIYDPNPKHGRDDPDELIVELVDAGGDLEEAKTAVFSAFNSKVKTKISIKNHDKNPYGFDSLTRDWTKDLFGALGWLNPEFNDIDPWAKKCFEEAQKGTRIALLTPLTVANWADKYCHGKALVLGLNPRLVFTGHTQSYPKDLMLTMYNVTEIPRFEVWKWKL